MLIAKSYQLKISEIGDEILCDYEKIWLEEFNQDNLDFEVCARSADPGIAGHKIAPADRVIEIENIRVSETDKEMLYRKLLDAMSPMIGVSKFVEMCVSMDAAISVLVDSDDCAAEMKAMAVKVEDGWWENS